MPLFCPPLNAANRKLIPNQSQPNKTIKIFAPNPGGQENLFKAVPLDEEYCDRIRWFYLRGGVGGGKSRAGSAFSESRTRLYPQIRGLITAQSFPQLRDSTLVALAEYCMDYGYELEPSGGSANDTARKIAYKQSCKINGVDVLVKSIESFTGVSERSAESGRGLEVGWVWYDEGAYGQKQGFDTLNTRLRWNQQGYFCHGLITSSINKNNPYNWIYDYFDDPAIASDLAEIHKTIVCSTYENIQGDPNYIDALKASLTKELFAVEVKGEYAAIAEDAVFNYFKRDRNCLDGYEIDPRYPIHVSLDFNHHPSCAIASQFLPVDKEIVVLNEWFLEHSDTFELSDAIATWFKETKGERYRDMHSWQEYDSFKLHVHGDASGNQKTANSKKTNWQIVKQAFKASNIDFITHYGKSNPSVKDTINSVNCAFKSEQLWIDNRCKELKKDMESLRYTQSGDIDKKTDIMRSHLADCLRYLVEDILPYSRIVRKERIVQSRPTGIIS